MADAEAEAIKRIAAAPRGAGRDLPARPQVPRSAAAISQQGKGSTIFLPAEATGVLGALGGLREMLRAREGSDTSPGSAPLPGRASGAPSLGYPDPTRGMLGTGRGGDGSREG
jgi:hypothetical protein